MAVLPPDTIQQSSEVALQQIDWIAPAESTEIELIDYLKDELAVSDDSIDLALRHCQQERGTLPMVLWRYGFVSIDQLNQIFDWMAR
ncbi:hypothetical protein NIES2135_39690 [Leptolyngbya boryana NIES-2135]|jgi:hypothetical protein|uniref:DUF2949 domain-containing protein n=1 Tax=Leptolyngbya boryana NIES-2135 TaxID=1973484 RepID=A0A1Z4JK35_LEPBY|nr:MULTISPECIES: DUF2949 domain-containing protein [Leptolyngbya]BAY57105.1 hypothetical protein NIES2135_39690 [Leptolyngbya boryana NIES-2135]MBD2367141.1 DUF2949 domain-containing protein [Leptolyngbya sp. FACHB-161]MBD2373505.1 DUF2949 domain-containing protein [Leptolyngbya sp. FACHB-238]MBD2397914.1 DUF2949 domain-containing protein [Leptolyngbya sp. FACHB-239]MBD2404415.1 DUF2949 domain-containing protein [Leptolyngbya sp. FACHB-402]